MNTPRTPTTRRDAENTVIREALRGLIRAGYRINVNNGEDTPIANSRDIEAITKELRQTDYDWLTCSDADNTAAGYVCLIYGNDPSEVIADYTTNLDDAISDALNLARSHG